jgi:phosphoribosylanthranilate isomerase
MMVKVKICGITSLEDALAAAGCGADALGFVFYKKSPRYVSPDEAAGIVRGLPPFITSVGVFVDEEGERIKEIMAHAGLDVAQFHGSEPPEACRIVSRAIKALRVKGPGDVERLRGYEVSAFLLDAYSPHAPGGTGEVFNWEIAREAKRLGRIILAGGLTPGNVGEAIGRVGPYAVDVSSGVEREKGVKDHEKLKLFMERCRAPRQ